SAGVGGIAAEIRAALLDPDIALVVFGSPDAERRVGIRNRRRGNRSRGDRSRRGRCRRGGDRRGRGNLRDGIGRGGCHGGGGSGRTGDRARRGGLNGRRGRRHRRRLGIGDRVVVIDMLGFETKIVAG